VQGSSLRVDVVDRPMPGAIGTLRLIVHKDRPGAVRKISTKDTEQIAGVVVLDSTEPEISRMVVKVPNPDDVVIGNSESMERKLGQLARLQELQDAILELFQGKADKRVTSAMVAEETQATRPDIRTAWDILEKMDKVVSYGAGRGRYYLLKIH